MAHLTDIELVDLLDGTLPPSRTGHLSGCADCTARIDAVRATALAVKETAAEEPSPLFWDAFPARVGAALDAAPASSWWRRPVFASAAAVAVAIIALTFVAQLRTPGSAPSAPVAAPPAIVTAVPIEGDVEGDAAWAVVRTAAEDLEYDDALAAGLSARPGDAERAAMELTEAERAELVRLLEDEMKRTGA